MFSSLITTFSKWLLSYDSREYLVLYGLVCSVGKTAVMTVDENTPPGYRENTVAACIYHKEFAAHGPWQKHVI